MASSFASLLLEEASEGLAVIDLPVRAGALAAAIGVAPESFSRAVTKAASGLLHRLGPRRLQVLDPDRLRAAAAGAEGS